VAFRFPATGRPQISLQITRKVAPIAALAPIDQTD